MESIKETMRAGKQKIATCMSLRGNTPNSKIPRVNRNMAAFIIHFFVFEFRIGIVSALTCFSWLCQSVMCYFVTNCSVGNKLA